MLVYAGTHFDPKLIELFVRVVKEYKASLPAMAIATSPADRLDS
jgi:response regulator RpfG family c-di-GMP phosphodiesterase